MLSSLLAGLGLGLSLIVAIGPQNAHVLRQGARREHVVTVVAVCAVSDTLLIAAGVGGFGAALSTVPWLLETLRWAGAVVVAGYGIHAAVRAIRGGGALPLTRSGTAPASAPGDATVLAPARTGRRLAAVGTTLALTWLNPHVYLDTLVLMGTVGAQHGDLRWYFALGAVCGSWIWFTALGLGAWQLAPVLARPAAWRVIDGVIAVVMLTVAVSLALG